MLSFYEKVYQLTKNIPRGRVASYGQLAGLISTPRAARVVGWCLHIMDNDSTLPWHRVINSRGYISTTCETHPANLQAALLKKEGIMVIRKDDLWWIDMKEYQWRPKVKIK